MSDGLDDVFERFLVESLFAMSAANSTLYAIRPRKERGIFRTFHHPRSIHSHHGVVGPPMLIPLDRQRHRQPTVESHTDQLLNRHEIRHRSQRPIFAKRMSGIPRFLLDQTF